MDIDITSVEIPDLSRQIKLSSFKPHFNGNYSSVYQGNFQDQLVAVKVIKEVYGAQPHTIERKLKRERTTWALLRHPNILPLWGFANDHELFEPFGALISPWRAQGNACDFLKGQGKELTKGQRLDMWKGVVAGVEYLHNHTPVLVHGDLKLANVMIDNQYSPQICDFGLVSIFLEEGHSGMTTTSNHTGTDRYLAYELLRDSDTVIPTVASDIFALGCVGLEFCFLRTPYSNRKNNMQGRIFADIRAGIQPATPDTGCDAESQQIWNLLGQCWEHNPKQRPSAGDLLASLQLQRTEANRNPNTLPQSAPSLHPEINTRSLGISTSSTAYMESTSGPIFQPSTDRGHQSDVVFIAPTGSELTRKKMWSANDQLTYQPPLDFFSTSAEFSANKFNQRGSPMSSPALNFQGQNSSSILPPATNVSTIPNAQERLEGAHGPSSPLIHGGGASRSNPAHPQHHPHRSPSYLDAAETIYSPGSSFDDHVAKQFAPHQQQAALNIMNYKQVHPFTAIPASFITADLAEVQDVRGWCLVGNCGVDRAKQRLDPHYDPAKDTARKRLDILYDHIRDRHFDDRSFRCSVYPCTQSFSREHGLKRHEKTHTAVSLPCDVCGKCYTREDNLKRHMQLKHLSPPQTSRGTTSTSFTY